MIAEGFYEGQIGWHAIRVVSTAVERRPAGCPRVIGKLIKQPALAHTRLSGYEHYSGPVKLSVIQKVLEIGEFSVSSDEGRGGLTLTRSNHHLNEFWLWTFPLSKHGASYKKGYLDSGSRPKYTLD